MEHVPLLDPLHVAPDVVGKARVDFVQHVLAVVERPELAHRLVADPDDHAAQIIEGRLDGGALGLPVFPGSRQPVRDQAALAIVVGNVGREIIECRLMRQIVNPGARVDDRLERRVGRNIGDPLALDPDRATIPQARPVVVAAPKGHGGGASGIAVPIMPSRVTSAASAASPRPSVPAGRIGSTR